MPQTQRTATLAAIKRSLKVVLENSRNAVIGEPLAELNYSDQPCRDRQVLRHMSQSSFLVGGGLLVIVGVGEVIIISELVVRVILGGDILLHLGLLDVVDFPTGDVAVAGKISSL